MKTMNQVILLGNLAKDPIFKEIDENTVLAEMTVVTNRLTSKNGDKAEIGDFHQIVVWRKLAELCNKFLKKGSKVMIMGKLVYSKYKNKEGKNIKKTEIHADEIKFLSANKDMTVLA